MPEYPVHHLSPFVFEIGDGFGLRWYGVAYVLAFMAAYTLGVWQSRRGFSDIPAPAVGDFITGTALFGVILGGRLGYLVFYDWAAFSANPLVFFKFWEGGMASHGGILGIVIFTWIYARRHRIPWLNVGDSLVVAAPVGLFLGRCANFINGELYGRASTVAWARYFPSELHELPPKKVEEVIDSTVAANPLWNSVPAVIENAGDPRVAAILAAHLVPRHPSQIYEALLEGGVLFAILWILRTRCRLPDGVLTGVFFIGYAVLRIGGEAFREPDAGLTWGLTRGQFLSLFMILGGAAFLARAFQKPTFPQALRRVSGKAS